MKIIELISIAVSVLITYSLSALLQQHSGHEPFWLKAYALFGAVFVCFISPVYIVFSISGLFDLPSSMKVGGSIFAVLTSLIVFINFTSTKTTN